MNSEKLRETLRKAEGVKTKPYQDTVGKWTIGVGRNLDDVGLSLGEIDFLLSNDITKAWASVTATWPWVVHLSDVRQRVLCEMVFQMGLGGVMAFKKFLAAMEAGDWTKASVEMLDSLWAKQTPSRAHRLAVMVQTDEDVT